MKEVKIDGEIYIPKASVETHKKPTPKKGKEYCIVRTYSAGVFAGWYDRKTKGQEGTLFDARRIWYWAGAASLSQLAVDGTTKPSTCKFPVAVSEVQLKEIVEVIPCTEKSRKSIEGVPIWKQ